MKLKLFFCGADEVTLLTLLQEPDFDCCAVNLLPEFLQLNTLHPIEWLFSRTYRALVNKEKKAVVGLLILHLFYYFGTSLTKKYHHYLRAVWQRQITIVDVRDSIKAAAFIKQNAFDLMVVSTWWLLPDEIIYAPRLGTLNIHPAKLPKYRGSVPTLWALKNNDSVTAVSFMLLNNKMDDGDILAQYDVYIDATDDSITLEDKCNVIIAAQLANTIKQYHLGHCKQIKQDIAQASKTARYYDYQRIDGASENCKDIINKTKLYPYAWPLDLCYLIFHQRAIHVKRVHYCSKEMAIYRVLAEKPCGYVLVKAGCLYLKATDGILMARLFLDIPWRESVYLLRYALSIKRDSC